MRTRTEALRYPRGDLELGFCEACGFVANTRYDPADRDYSALYEETQGYSGRFNTFQASLVHRLVHRYDVRGKTVLEIGCGKGDFLSLLCLEGDNRGIGLDPACVPGRLDVRAADRIHVIRDYYSTHYKDLPADVICCRHTLEHIPDTGRFLRMVRKAIGSREDVLVFFEVPDTLRVLREGAFWDIYYEHCSYFTPGSLGRLFRACGFEILELYLDYDGQYIMLTARPAARSPATPAPLERDTAATADAVRQFGETVRVAIDAWRSFIIAHAGKTVVWQSGSKAVAFLTTLGIDQEIPRVVDINPYRHGKFIPGSAQEIIPPQGLLGCRPEYVIAMNPIYRDEIRRRLDEMALRPELLAV
jgi:SAM-dependent methyltransferase